jgi:hypothetical protein
MPEDKDSHFSIELPNHEVGRVYVPFEVFESNKGGHIIRLSWHAIGAINTAIKNYLPVVKSIDSPGM